tara:strand:- start:583 stop:1521 length:939 start_codon:yes stop_codon:yes gene_type:complete
MMELNVTSKEAIERLGRVAVIMGGNSAEREVSLKSGRAVLDALQTAGVDAIGIDAAEDLIGQLQAKNITQVFNVLHGRGGEDGKLQGLLDFMGIPYTGSRVLGSALAMDKIRTKYIWLQIGLPTPNFTVLSASSDWNEVVASIGKAVVKPVREGSSIGISIVDNGADMRSAYERACAFDPEVMAEQYIDGTEFTVAILNGEAMPVIEFHTPHKFYDYDAKYIANDTQYLCPAPLDEETTAYLQALSLEAFNAVGCEGWGRVDLMRDQQGQYWLLEVNTVPGMTDHSLVPMAATAKGMSFTELLLQILAAKPL